MKTGAIWAIALVSLSTYGSMEPDKNSLSYFASAVFLCTAVAVPIYFYRIKIFNFVEKQFGANITNTSKPEKSLGKIIIFQLANVLAQLIAIVAGFFSGLLINSIVLVALMLAKNSLSG